MRLCHLSDGPVVSSILDCLSVGMHPSLASASYKNISLSRREVVRGDSVNPLLFSHAQNIGSHYMSPQWRLVPIAELLTFIMTFSGHTPNAQQQPGFYGDSVAQYAALHKENTHTEIKTDKVSRGNEYWSLIALLSCFMLFL